jgi:tetratricopeptide (TPR) repeat protein
LGAQNTPELKRDRTPAANSGKEEVPPEEDASLAKDDYSFNPLQSKRDVEVGDLYRKKGNWIAASRRYQTATLRNDGNTEAWLKLGEARQKLHDGKGAKEAYGKYLELDPSSKTAQEVRKTLAKLK